MKEYRDCLFIGHNETKFEIYEKMLKSMGKEIPAYRDLEMSFTNNDGKVCTFSDVFNMYFNSDDIKYEDYKLSLGNLFSPTIAYLGTFLSKRGFCYNYINSFQDDKDKLEEMLKSYDYMAIIIPTTLYISPLPLIEIISFVKEYNEKAKIIVGGPFISTQVKLIDCDETLQYFFESINADFYINSSQGETALVNVLDSIKNNNSYEGIDNIHYKENNKFVKNHISLEDNILSENMVDWSLFEDDIRNILAVRTSISCAFSCKFCGFPQHAGKYQFIDISKIEQELNDVDRIGKVKSLNFIDDTLNVPPDRFKEMLKMMVRNNYKFKWNSHYRCQFADEETVALMKESGCEGVFLGVESGDPGILKNMNKAATIEKYRKGIELLKKYEIITYASFIIGFPGETDDSVQNTINFINETQPDFFRTQLWYCDPITPIWKEKDIYKIEGSQFQWTHRTMDAVKACNWINKIFLSVDSSVWVPQYNFEFNGIFSLIHLGFSIEEVKRILTIFNQSIRDRLTGIDNEMRQCLIDEFRFISNRCNKRFSS